MALKPNTLKALFGKLTPLADDIAKGVANYGDDAARLVADYGDDVARIASQYGDDAARGVKNLQSLTKAPAVETMSNADLDSYSNLIRTSLRDIGNSKLPLDTPLPGLDASAKQVMTVGPFATDTMDFLKHVNYGHPFNEHSARFFKDNAGRVGKLDLLSDGSDIQIDPDGIFDFVSTGADFDTVPTESVLGYTFPQHQLVPGPGDSYVPHRNTALGRWFAKNNPNYGDGALQATGKVDDFLPAFEDPSLSFGEVLPYTRRYAPDYWQDVAYMSGTTINPKNSTIKVRGKDIHYPMTDNAAGKAKLDKLWNVLNPDEELLFGPNFGPEYSVESVAMGENVPGFPALTKAVREFEDFGLDDVFGGDVDAATDAYENYRNRLQSRLNLAASIPKGYVPIDELHDTDFRPHLNTAEYRHSPLSQKFTKFGKPRYPNFDPNLPF